MNPTNKVIDAVKLSEANILEELGKLRELIGTSGESPEFPKAPLSSSEVAQNLITKSIEDALRETPTTRISPKAREVSRRPEERKRDAEDRDDSEDSEDSEDSSETE